MIALVAAAAIAPAYSFAPGDTHAYDVKVNFEGFLPVMGGNEGEVDVTLGMKVEGKEPVEARLQAVNEITSFELKWNGVSLPLDLTTVTEVFPRTTIEIRPTGGIVKNDAPDAQLPVRLPGLDSQHFPDITYVPLVFPENELKQGATWTFTRKFGESEIHYGCMLEEADEKRAKISVKIAQEYEVFESETLEVVPEADAVSKAKTRLDGEGTVIFNIEKGVADRVQMKNTAKTTVTPLKGGSAKTRTLVTTYDVTRKGAQADPVVTARQPETLWERTVAFGQRAWQQTAGYLSIAKLAILQWLSGRKLGSSPQ